MDAQQNTLTHRTWKSTLAGLALALVAGLAAVALGPTAAHAACPNCPAPDPGGSGGIEYVEGVASTAAVFQFSPCLPDAQLNQFRATAQAAIASAIDAMDLENDGTELTPEFHGGCTASGSSVLAVWFSTSVYDGQWQGREDLLQSIDELQPGETVAMRFRKPAIHRLLGEAFGDLVSMEPPGVNVGEPDVALHGSTNGNAAIKRLVTTFPGVVGPSQTDFWVTFTDHIMLQNAKVRCSTAAALDTEDDAVDYGLDEQLSFIDPFDPNSMLHDLALRGPGCRILGAAPDQVMLPGSFQFLGGRVARKHVFNYTRLVVDGAGVRLGGTHQTTARYPEAWIEGPSSVQAETTEPASATYRVVTADLRPPFTITWSSPSATIVRNGTQASITWPTPITGMGVQRAITVTVTDADGLTASSTKNVLVKRPHGGHVGNGTNVGN